METKKTYSEYIHECNVAEWEVFADRISTVIKELGTTDYLLLAGGAVRDLALCKSISDFDIYTYHNYNGFNAFPPKLHPKLHKALERTNGFKKITRLSDDSYFDTKFNTYEVIFSSGLKWNIIVHTQLVTSNRKDIYSQLMQHTMGSFDINLCKCCYNFRDLRFSYSVPFRHDADNQLITVDREKYNKNPSHLEKICNKYPEYKVQYV